MTVDAIHEQARAGCTCGDEVWLCCQQGGLAVHDAVTRADLGRVALPRNGAANSQAVAITAAGGDVWLSTTDGELLCVRAASRQVAAALRVPGTEKKAPLPSLAFLPDGNDGAGAVAVASATGRVLLVCPRRRTVVHSFSTTAPCSAVAEGPGGLVFAGDEDGGLYAWVAAAPDSANAATPPVLCSTKSRSKVRHLLFEDTTQRLWVARENGNVDVYAVSGTASPESGFTLEKRAEALGRVTAMVAVGGKVVVSTFERRLISVDAKSVTVIAPYEKVHTSFIHSMVKVRVTEAATIWSMGNDEVVRDWLATGYALSAAAGPQHARRRRCGDVFDLTGVGAGAAARAAEEVSLREELQKAREEAQEMRLRVVKMERDGEVKVKEIADKAARIKELEEANAKLTKDVTDITTKANNNDRESTMNQSELSRTRDELSRARVEASTRLAEKAKVSEDLSKETTAKMQLEQRLHDAEARLTAIRAENARLCETAGNATTAARAAETEAAGKLLLHTAQATKQLEDARQVNRALSALVASMEYTLRRREEEDKDVVVLLNAYRRKVADHVTDPFLSALLIATMVRHPDRFDLECDPATKSALLERNGPFIQFVHTLRQSDPEAYEKLMSYLQKSATTVADGDAIPAESREMLDRFVALAAREGELTPDAITALKRSIPTPVTAASVAGAAGAAAAGSSGSPLPQGASPTTALGGGTGAASPGAAGAAGTASPGPAPGTTAAVPFFSSAGAAAAAAGGKVGDEESVSLALLRELRSERAIEDSYVREHRAMFEFILLTRRALVECLVQMQRRTAGAQQVVEAMCANAAAAASPAASPGPAVSPTSGGRLLPLQTVFLGIVRELAELAAATVTQYLTSAEKQRLNIH